ncbi:MAG: substrate-binding domain-containing protein [Clostridia bacterium]|nr:substrate-binding domain-containing protein [Clostridia bacterium]
MKALIKNITSVAICSCMVLSCFACTADENAQASDKKTSPPFIRLECELPELWGDKTILSSARIKATGEVLPISFAYDDAVYVQTDLDSDLIEGFVAEEPENYKDVSVESNYAFSTKFWTVRGVFGGDGDGNFRGEDFISRAEAVAVISRFLGIKAGSDTNSGFSDVAHDSWYAPIVTEAKKAGIISADNLFRPDDKVLRQEFFTMACRAFDALGWLKNSRNAEYEILDMDKADLYAQQAYKKLIASGFYIDRVSRDEQTGGEGINAEYGYYLDPKENMKRGDASELLYWGLSDLPVVPSKAAMLMGFDKEMPIIDGSTSSYPITEVLYWQFFNNANNHTKRPAAHSKTINSYKRLISGEADVIFVPDPNEEVEKLAKESGVELSYTPIADEALIFFTSVKNNTEGLTTDQIKNIYVDNKHTNWSEFGGPDKKLIPFCRNNDSGSHAQMEKFFLEGKEINEDIKRENTSVMMASILTDVISSDTKNQDSYALGYSMFYYFKNAGMVLGVTDPNGNDMLKLLAVDGIMPTKDSISNRTYPLSTHYYAVLRSDEPDDSPARKIAELLSSPAGAALVEQAGFGAVNADN